MKHFDFDNQWDAIKGQLKQRYGQLTDDDLTFVQGKGDELLTLLRMKLGLTATELNATLHDLQAQAGGRFQEVKAKVGELADEARAKAGVIADDLREKAAAFTDEAKAQGAAAYDQARQRFSPSQACLQAWTSWLAGTSKLR